jgi:excisionase family DNA binding protein
VLPQSESARSIESDLKQAMSWPNSQRVCEPHFAASDSLEQTSMAAESVQSTLAMRPRDAAKALGISPRLLCQLTHDGQIPFAKVRRTVLYPTADLQAWLSRQADGAKGGSNVTP